MTGDTNGLLNYTYAIMDLANNKAQYYQVPAWSAGTPHRLKLDLGVDALFME